MILAGFFQGIEEFKKTVIRNSSVKIISIILIFLLVKSEDDLLLYILILGGSTLLGQLSMWVYMPRMLKKCPRKSLNIKRHLKPTFMLFLPSIATYVYTFLDKIMLGAMQDTSEVGYYSQSEKIVKIAMTVITSLGTVLVPRLSNLIKKGEWNSVRKYFAKSVHFVFILGVPMMLGMIIVASDLVPWFLGEGFEQSVLLMQLLSPLVLIIGIASVTGQAVLVSMERQSYYTVSVICGSITNMLLNLLLIPKLKSSGAVAATLMAEFVVTFMQVLGVRKIVDFKQIIIQNIKCIISGCIMFLLLIVSDYLFIQNLNSMVIRIVVKVCIGVFSYGVMLLVLREQMVFEVLNIILIKLHLKRS